MAAFERVRGNAIYTPSETRARESAASQIATTPLEAAPLTGRQLCDYSDMSGYAIKPASYRVAAANTTDARFADAEADSKTAAMERARTMSAEAAGVSFGVYAVRDGEGSCLVASFFNGERRFTARAEDREASR